MPGNLVNGTNVSLGRFASASQSTSFRDNITIGISAGVALVSGTAGQGSNNLLIGSNAGSSITTGSGNIVIGNYTGTATTTNAVCISNSTGQACITWDGSNRSAKQAIGDTQPTLDAGTLSWTYNNTKAELLAAFRRTGQNTDVTIRLSDVQTLSDTVTGINAMLGGLTG